MQKTDLRAIAPGHIRYNGGTQCDMAIGPCACGAWHIAEERIPQANTEAKIQVWQATEDEVLLIKEGASNAKHPLDIIRERIPDITADETTADAVARLVRERDEARAETLSLLGQLEERPQITVWASQDAPEPLRALSKHDKDWVVWVPTAWFKRHYGLPSWLEHGLRQNTVSRHVVDGGMVFITRGPAYLWLG